MTQDLEQVQYALWDCFSATGAAPTKVSELKTLFGIYLEPGGSLTAMLETGKDCWGNSLVILPVHGKPGRFTLRSLGPDGKLQTGPGGDDIVMTYPAESRAAKHQIQKTTDN